MRLPIPNDDRSRRVGADTPAARELLYELRETSLLNGNSGINGHGNGDVNAHSVSVPVNGNGELSRHVPVAAEAHAEHITTNGNGVVLEQNGHAHGDLNGNEHSGSNSVYSNGNNHNNTERVRPLMVDIGVQYSYNMDSNDVSDYNGGVHMEAMSSSPIRDADVAVTVTEWSPSGLNETMPVASKAAQLNESLLSRIQPTAEASSTPANTDDTIKAWKNELANQDAALASSSNSKPKPPPPNTDDGPRYKINNEGPSDTPDGDRDHNTSTWRVRDRSSGSASTSSDDEIEKISMLEMAAGGDGGKPEQTDGSSVRNKEPSNRAPKSDRPEEEEEDGECVIRCLAYTLQCCECVIS